jgi:neutral ceramidase
MPGSAPPGPEGITSTPTGASPLRAGSARVNITPASPQYLDGYGNRTSASEGVYLPIYARALYLAAGTGEALVISAEVLAYDRPQARRLRTAVSEATGLSPDTVILLATHTHCAPRVCEMVMPGTIDAGYVSWFEQQLVQVAREARAAPRPARALLSRATGSLGINRRVQTPSGTVMRPNPMGENDRSVRTLWIEDSAAVPLASITVYACHPTSRGGLLIGGDYPGFFSQALEQRGMGTALFALGCAGDIRPGFTGPEGGFRQAEIPEVREAGAALADAALAGATQKQALSFQEIRVATGEAILPFAARPFAATLRQTLTADPNPLRRQWAERMSRIGAPNLPADTPFQIQVLGLVPTAAWVFLAGEMVVDYARLLGRDSDPIAIPAGYANGSVGYVPSRRIYPEEGYEVTGSHHYYGQPAPFAPEVEAIVIAAAERLIRAALVLNAE